MRCIRQRYQWKLRDREVPLGGRTLIMGVLDAGAGASPGERPDADEILQTALELQDQGADVIDVYTGPEGFRGKQVPANEELRRLVPVLRKLHYNLEVPLSVNTYNAETADRALELGAQIISDVSGLSFDPQLIRVVNQRDAGLILTHRRGPLEAKAKLPPVPDVLKIIVRDLKSSIDRAIGAGIDRRRIVIDPGLDLGKRGIENYRILTQLERLAGLNQPILVSPSRKPFLTESVRAPEAAWLFGAAAAVTVAICAGAHIVRVHEVEAMSQVRKVADRVFEASE